MCYIISYLLENSLENSNLIHNMNCVEHFLWFFDNLNNFLAQLFSFSLSHIFCGSAATPFLLSLSRFRSHNHSRALILALTHRSIYSRSLTLVLSLTHERLVFYKLMHVTENMCYFLDTQILTMELCAYY